MGARYLTDLGDVLTAAGLDVVLVDGWQTRSRSSGGYDGDRPWCAMWHHTASQASAQGDVDYICSGSPDAPLANLYLARDGEVWICAAGATNTNGKGDAQMMTRGVIPADSMNTHAIGIEAANNGVGEQWPQVQIDAYFTINNALANAYGLAPDDCCTHHQYAPDRKIDPATANAVKGVWQPRSINSSGTWNVDDVRDECWIRAGTPGPQPPTPTPPTAEDDMRISPFLIQTTDGSGRVFCTDGQLMTYRVLRDEQALAGYRWTARTASPGIERSYPELADGGPITAVADLGAYGVLID